MAKIDVVRAWKDAAYRESLAPEEQALLPENPAGAIELTDTDLSGVSGGLAEPMTITWGCDYSYEHRPSCGQYCTLTYECGCGREVASVSVE